VLRTRLRCSTAERRRTGGRAGAPREGGGLALTASRLILRLHRRWCGPCKLLDKDWNDPSIAKTVNAAFVPARVVDRAREDGENPPDVAELQKRYEVSGFPTLVAAAPDGRLIAKLEGYRGRAALVEFLEEAKKR
jgi:thiol-disulfide isomerase/thioredoxin